MKMMWTRATGLDMCPLEADILKGFLEDKQLVYMEGPGPDDGPPAAVTPQQRLIVLR